MPIELINGGSTGSEEFSSTLVAGVELSTGTAVRLSPHPTRAERIDSAAENRWSGTRSVVVADLAVIGLILMGPQRLAAYRVKAEDSLNAGSCPAMHDKDAAIGDSDATVTTSDWPTPDTCRSKSLLRPIER